MEGDAAVSAREALYWALWDNYTQAEKNTFIDAFARELAETTPAARHCEQQRQPHGVHLWESTEGAAGAVTGLWYCPGGTTA